MTKEFKDYTTALGRYCRNETFNGDYRAFYNFLDKPCEEDTDESTTHLKVTVNCVYLYVNIQVFPQTFELYKRGDFKQCGENMLHEFCRIFLEPLARELMVDCRPSQLQANREIVERQTQRITYAIYSILPKDWYLPKNVLKYERRIDA